MGRGALRPQTSIGAVEEDARVRRREITAGLIFARASVECSQLVFREHDPNHAGFHIVGAALIRSAQLRRLVGVRIAGWNSGGNAELTVFECRCSGWPGLHRDVSTIV